jgi:hypothetical protein
MVIIGGVSSAFSESEASDILAKLYPMMYDFDWTSHSDAEDTAVAFMSTLLSKEKVVLKCDCCIAEMIKSSYICTGGTGRCSDEMCETEFWSLIPSRFLKCAISEGCNEPQPIVIKSD